MALKYCSSLSVTIKVCGRTMSSVLCPRAKAGMFRWDRSILFFKTKKGSMSVDSDEGLDEDQAERKQQHILLGPVLRTWLTE